MATEKVLKARLQNKYETLENWNALPRGSFIPLKGELCLASDKDNAYGYYKVGDGETDFVDLPWLLNQGNWNENDKNTPGYVKNRPMYTEIPEDAEAILEIGYKSGDEISEAAIVEGTTAIMGEGREFTREDASKAWEFKVNIKSDNDINPIDLFIEGPIYLKELNTADDDTIYYYGNFYRFYVLQAMVGLQEEIATGEITIEDIEQMVRDELQIEDSGENYAFVNLYGSFYAVVFDQTPGDINNFTYEFNIYSYTTIVHKLDSKYLEEVNLVGKFEDIDNFSEIFNDYANNRAQSPYSHAEGQQTEVWTGATAAHVEGYKTIASSTYAHAEGKGTKASGTAAHVEGADNEAQGPYSHSEGLCTKALYKADHSEGEYTIAQGTSGWGPAHAEGYGAIAIGTGTHAEGGINLVQNNWTEFKEQGYYEYKASGATCTVASNSKINLSYPISAYPAIINVYSDEKSFQVYNTGELVSGTLSNEIVEAGILNNVYFRVYDKNIGASGDYTHVEGYDNTAIGDYNHIEGCNNFANGDTNHITGYNNLSKGDINFIAGQYNIIEGNSQFALGYGLQSDGETGQILLGKYNEVVPGANLIIGAGIETTRSNQLVLDNYGELQIPKNRIVDGEKDIWKQVSSKFIDNYNKTFHIFYEEDCEFERSTLIKPNLFKLTYSMSSGTPYIYYRNGNIFNVSDVSDQTLENGTTLIVDKENNSFIINAKASDTQQKFTFYSLFSDADEHVHYYYCWDELADPEIYYGIDGTVNPGNNLIYHYNSIYNESITLDIYIEPGVEKEIILPFPVLTTCVPPKKWVPPMEKILIPRDTKSVEIDISQYPFNGQVSMESPHHSNWFGAMYAVPKAVINENRMTTLLNQYIPENQYIIDLTQEDSNISFVPETTTLSLSIKLGQKIDGVWTSNYKGITSEQLELVELFPEAMQSLLVGDQNSGFKLPDGIFINNTADSEWSMPTRALYDLLAGGNIASITNGHVRLEHGYNEFDTCYLKWYIGLGDVVDSEIETVFAEIITQLATATHFVFYLPHGRNNIYLN